VLFYIFSLFGLCSPYGPFWPILVYTKTLDSIDGCEVILPNSSVMHLLSVVNLQCAAHSQDEVRGRAVRLVSRIALSFHCFGLI